MQYSAPRVCTILLVSVAAVAWADTATPGGDRTPRAWEARCGKRLLAARDRVAKSEPLFNVARIGLLRDGIELSWLDLRVVIRDGQSHATMDEVGWYNESDRTHTAATRWWGRHFAYLLWPSDNEPPEWLLGILRAAADDCLAVSR
jgi:hypothetical protein